MPAQVQGQAQAKAAQSAPSAAAPQQQAMAPGAAETKAPPTWRLPRGTTQAGGSGQATPSGGQESWQQWDAWEKGEKGGNGKERKRRKQGEEGSGAMDVDEAQTLHSQASGKPKERGEKRDAKWKDKKEWKKNSYDDWKATGAEASSQGEDIGAALAKLSKLSLATAQNVRTLQGSVLTTFLVKSSLDWIGAADEEGRSYALAVQDEGPGHTRGAAHPHKWYAMIEVALQDRDFQLKEPDAARALSNLLAYVQKDVQMVMEFMPTLLVKRCFDKGAVGERHKVQWSVATYVGPQLGAMNLRHEDIQGAHERLMLYYGGERRRGAPPKASVERDVERILRRPR